MDPPKREDEDRCSRWVNSSCFLQDIRGVTHSRVRNNCSDTFRYAISSHTIYSVCPVCHLFYLLCMPFIPLFHTDSDCPMVSSNSSSYVIYFKQEKKMTEIMYVCLMVLNATFNNISAILQRSVLSVEETGGPGENHQSAASH